MSTTLKNMGVYLLEHIALLVTWPLMVIPAYQLSTAKRGEKLKTPYLIATVKAVNEKVSETGGILRVFSVTFVEIAIGAIIMINMNFWLGLDIILASIMALLFVAFAIQYSHKKQIPVTNT